MEGRGSSYRGNGSSEGESAEDFIKCILFLLPSQNFFRALCLIAYLDLLYNARKTRHRFARQKFKIHFLFKK